MDQPDKDPDVPSEAVEIVTTAIVELTKARTVAAAVIAAPMLANLNRTKEEQLGISPVTGEALKPGEERDLYKARIEGVVQLADRIAGELLEKAADSAAEMIEIVEGSLASVIETELEREKEEEKPGPAAGAFEDCGADGATPVPVPGPLRGAR